MRGRFECLDSGFISGVCFLELLDFAFKAGVSFFELLVLLLEAVDEAHDAVDRDGSRRSNVAI